MNKLILLAAAIASQASAQSFNYQSQGVNYSCSQSGNQTHCYGSDGSKVTRVDYGLGQSSTEYTPPPARSSGGGVGGGFVKRNAAVQEGWREGDRRRDESHPRKLRELQEFADRSASVGRDLSAAEWAGLAQEIIGSGAVLDGTGPSKAMLESIRLNANAKAEEVRRSQQAANAEHLVAERAQAALERERQTQTERWLAEDRAALERARQERLERAERERTRR